MHHRRLVQMCKLSHIIRFVELCRIDSVNLVDVHFSLLADCKYADDLSTSCSYLPIIRLYQ